MFESRATRINIDKIEMKHRGRDGQERTKVITKFSTRTTNLYYIPKHN